MAAILVPGVQHRLLPGKSTTPLDPRFVVVHTMVGTLAGSESWFTPSGRPYSHFGAGGSGEVRQWQDLRYRAASDLNGNPYSISIECEDRGTLFPAWSGSDVPRFTPAQADSLVVLLSWLCHRFGLPKAAIATSCPHERGIGWHRLGIDPYRRAGCLLWSSSSGKACPGDRRIHQLVTEIIPRVSSPEDSMTPAQEAKLDRVLDSLTRVENKHFPAASATTKDSALRLGHFLTTGSENALFAGQLADDLHEWIRDPDTIALPRLLQQVLAAVRTADVDVDEAAIIAGVREGLVSQLTTALVSQLPAELDLTEDEAQAACERAVRTVLREGVG